MVVVALLLLSFTPVLSVQSVQALGTRHLSSADIVNLAAIPQGSSIVTLDTEAIRQNVSQNPWVGEVAVDRGLDGTVTISVTEREPLALVTFSSQEMAWYLSDDGIWLEPSELHPAGGMTIFDIALSEARAEGIKLVTDVPETVVPTAGLPCEDPAIEGVLSYQREFDATLADQVAYYAAASESSISCVLVSGLEISLGAPTDIAAKQTVIQELLSEYPNRLTYINVRVPSRPTYRMVEGDDQMTGGTGIYEPAVTPPEDAGTDGESDGSGEGSEDSGDWEDEG